MSCSDFYMHIIEYSNIFSSRIEEILLFEKQHIVLIQEIEIDIYT